jgi:hypothetical protein
MKILSRRKISKEIWRIIGEWGMILMWICVPNVWIQVSIIIIHVLIIKHRQK